MKLGESPERLLSEARALIHHIARALSDSPLQQSFDEHSWLTQCDELQRNLSPEKPTYTAGLTKREIEVLRLVAIGATNQQIADALTISPRTVNTHITNILNKTGCENRTAATAFAIRHKLVST